MSEGYTMIPVKPTLKEKLKKEKGIYSYTDEIDNLIKVKNKIKKGQKVTSEDLKLVSKKKNERIKG